MGRSGCLCDGTLGSSDLLATVESTRLTRGKLTSSPEIRFNLPYLILKVEGKQNDKGNSQDSYPFFPVISDYSLFR